VIGTVVGPLVSLRPLEEADAATLYELRVRNRDFLAPWEPLRTPTFHTLAGQRAEIERDRHEWAADRTYAFAIVDTEGAMVGRIALTLKPSQLGADVLADDVARNGGEPRSRAIHHGRRALDGRDPGRLDHIVRVLAHQRRGHATDPRRVAQELIELSWVANGHSVNRSPPEASRSRKSTYGQSSSRAVEIHSMIAS